MMILVHKRHNIGKKITLSYFKDKGFDKSNEKIVLYLNKFQESKIFNN